MQKKIRTLGLILAPFIVPTITSIIAVTFRGSPIETPLLMVSVVLFAKAIWQAFVSLIKGIDKGVKDYADKQ